MPIPFVALGLLGAVALGKSTVENSKAKDNNEIAQQNVNNARQVAELARQRCRMAIQYLGEQKIKVYDVEMQKFVKVFGKIKNIELEYSNAFQEIQKFKINNIGYGELSELSEMSLVQFGLAGGAAAVGSLLPPVMLILGLVASSKSSANLEKSYANLAKSREFEEEMKTVRTLCLGIRLRANMFERLLIRLNGYFQPSVHSLEKLVDTRGEDFRTYTREEKQIVASSVAIAQAIKAVLDTPILTEEGVLTEESENVALQMQEKLSVFRDQ